MERKSKRLLLLAGICSLLVVGTISLIYFYVIIPESEEYELELKVGYYDNKPKVFEDDEGNIKGIFPEILEYIADQEDWKIEWVYGSWEECLDRVENGKIDIMVDVAYSENRSQLYDFNSVEVLSNWGIIYSDAKGSIESIEDLEGKKVAVMEGSFHTDGPEGIINLTKKWEVNCEFVYLEDYEEVFEEIDKGKADAGVVNRIFGLINEENYDVERTSIMFNPSRLLFAFPKNADKNQELIPKIDEHLLVLKEDTDSIYYQLIDQYIYGQATGTIPVWVFPTLIIAFALVGIFILSSYILKRMVDTRTSELQKAHNELEKKVEERTQDLSEANERLKELDQLKSMFIASMSHELRTPLTSIIGFSKTLLKGWVGDLNEEQEKQLSIILRSGNYLLELINEIIDISKIEAGKLDISMEEFDLVELIENLKTEFKVQFEKKNVDLQIHTPEHLKIKSDKKRIRQILFNLVSNAIKFTDEGSVTVDLKEQNDQVQISVADTGPGIKQEDLNKLFKAFSRIPTKETKEGTGLGLHLSQKLARMLNGEISVESEYNNGSTFTLTLNLEKNRGKK